MELCHPSGKVFVNTRMEVFVATRNLLGQGISAKATQPWRTHQSINGLPTRFRWAWNTHAINSRRITKARVAAYKVCWPPIDGGECFDSDILAAFDMAIHDGVDVLSVSVGGDAGDYFNDGIAIGAFHATQHGIAVVCSAGNDGPTAGTVANVAPWLLTVGASTLDREFQALVQLRNGQKFKGSSLSRPLPHDKLYPLISAAQARAANASVSDAILCKAGTLDKSKVHGKILACLRGDNARVDKGVQAKLAGAVGMILCNAKTDGNEIMADLHVLPASHLTYHDGAAVFAYINSTRQPYGFISHTTIKLGTKPAPYMAAFSSQGPNTVTPEILKPDITAPGVNIIAAYSEATSPTEEPFDKRKVSFMVDSGTSMSCPHISGIVGLLKTRHPSWSPAAIRSAIMTTARVMDNTHKSMLNASTCSPNRAMDPGLVYDLTTSDYLNFLCDLGYNQTVINSFDKGHKCTNTSSSSILNLNYPTITVPKLSGSVTVTRTVKNVAGSGTYVARVHEPEGVKITVVPKVLKFEKVAEEKSYKVILTAKKGGLSQGYVFGDLVWTDGRHYVRSHIVVAAAN
ncbi:Subtilisin-like protease SBT5.4 [Bienertia sinuspersici]